MGLAGVGIEKDRSTQKQCEERRVDRKTVGVQ